MISPAVEEIASTVANLVISPLIVLKRRSPEEVVVEERATSVETKVISPETARPSPVEEGGTASIAENLVT
jgi:hypothetical protein